MTTTETFYYDRQPGPLCSCAEPRNDSLYPRTVNKCSTCGTIFRSYAYNGAVCWQCPSTLILNEKYHEPNTSREVKGFGFICHCGGLRLQAVE